MHFHQITEEIKRLTDMAREDYRKVVIDHFAFNALSNRIDYLKEQGKDVAHVHVQKHAETLIDVSKHKSIAYFIGVMDSKGSKWSGGNSVTNMMEQIQREVILEIIPMNWEKPELVKERMLEIIEEWED